MKRIILAISVFFFSINIFAQKFELGFIGGYQLTNAYAFVGGDIDKINFNPKPGSGFSIGGYFGWTFHKNFGLDVQLLYAMRSYSFNMQYVKSDTSTIFKRQQFNLELPVHLNYRIKINNKFTIYPLIGASVNMALHGKDIAYENTDVQKPVDKKTDSSSLFNKDGRTNRFEFSPEIGILFKYKNLGIRPLYSIGVTNLTNKSFSWTFYLPKDQSKYLFNRELKLTITYTFKL